MRASWDCLPESERLAWLARMSARELEYWRLNWLFWARDDQLPPEGDGWSTWLLMGGRGAGKTRAGAEWVRALATGHPAATDRRVGRIALVAETHADARDVMIEGVSGLLALHGRRERPLWLSSRRRLEWPNGAVAQVFSAEEPDSLRGPQFDAAWCDEIGKWRHAAEAWDMLQFGLRLGDHPRVAATTTPRPTPLIRRLIADATTAVSRAATRPTPTISRRASSRPWRAPMGAHGSAGRSWTAS